MIFTEVEAKECIWIKNNAQFLTYPSGGAVVPSAELGNPKGGTWRGGGANNELGSVFDMVI